MYEGLKITVVGGGDRQRHIAEELKKDGREVESFGIEGYPDSKKSLNEVLTSSPILILPLPLSKDDTKLNSHFDISVISLLDKIPEKTRILAGKISPRFKDYLEAKGIEYYDYFEDGELVWENAEITAEGAVSILMRELDIKLGEASILICGFGRIAKCLALKLKNIGSKVTVSARKNEDLHLAKSCMGVSVDKLDYMREGIFDLQKSYDAIVNTVPGWIFDDSNEILLRDKLYIELASAPYGGDLPFMKSNCGKYVLASALPEKYAPTTASKAVYEAIARYMKEAKL